MYPGISSYAGEGGPGSGSPPAPPAADAPPASASASAPLVPQVSEATLYLYSPQEGKFLPVAGASPSRAAANSAPQLLNSDESQLAQAVASGQVQRYDNVYTLNPDAGGAGGAAGATEEENVYVNQTIRGLRCAIALLILGFIIPLFMPIALCYLAGKKQNPVFLLLYLIAFCATLVYLLTAVLVSGIILFCVL